MDILDYYQYLAVMFFLQALTNLFPLTLFNNLILYSYNCSLVMTKSELGLPIVITMRSPRIYIEVCLFLTNVFLLVLSGIMFISLDYFVHMVNMNFKVTGK